MENFTFLCSESSLKQLQSSLVCTDSRKVPEYIVASAIIASVYKCTLVQRRKSYNPLGHKT